MTASYVRSFRSACRIPAGAERKCEKHNDCSNSCADSAMGPFVVHDLSVLGMECPRHKRTGWSLRPESETTHVLGWLFLSWLCPDSAAAHQWSGSPRGRPDHWHPRAYIRKTYVPLYAHTRTLADSRRGSESTYCGYWSWEITVFGGATHGYCMCEVADFGCRAHHGHWWCEAGRAVERWF